MRVFAQKQGQTQKKESSHLSRLSPQALKTLPKAHTVDLNAERSTSAATRFAHDFSRIPLHSKTPMTIQPKLATGAAGDKYEQEADRIAEQVTANPAHPAVSSAPPLIQRFSEQQNGQMGAAPAGVEEALAGPGSLLDPALRQDMEQRFGYDFSQVRVHTDSRAAESAQAVDARAYTVGKDVVFGAGEFSPHSTKGKRLLAHELTHVVQQTTAKSPPSLLQRAPQDKPQTRRNVVIVGGGWEGASELASVLSSGALVINVNSIGDVAAALAKINFPIGTIYFITHSTRDGSLRFGDGEKFIAPADIAGKLQGLIPAENSPQGVDFRGCSVGTSPKSMDQIRAAMGAQIVRAGTCFAVINRSTPIKIGGKEITKASDVTDRKLFVKLMEGTLESFAVGERKCILNRSEKDFKDFFAAGGRFVSLYFNPAFTGKWVPGKSVCYTDVARQVVDPNNPLPAGADCKLIEVKEKSVEQPVGPMRQYDDPDSPAPGRFPGNPAPRR